MALRCTFESLNKVFQIRALLTAGVSRNYCAKMSQQPQTIDFENLKGKVLNKNILLIDVRENKELVEDGKIPNSVNIPLGEVTDAFNLPSASFQSKYGVPKPSVDSEEFVLSCKSGRRASSAFEKIQALGFKKALVYTGSFLDWVKNSGPVEK